MKNTFHEFILFLFPKESNGINNPLTNQLIYSQLKNRLIMMTQKPSSVLAKWKYSGVIPILLMAMLIFSFREKEQIKMKKSYESTVIFDPSLETTSYKDYNIYKDGLKIYTAFDNTEPPLFPGCEKVNEMEKSECSHKNLYEYLAQHLKYPEEMKAQKTEGKVYIKFYITTNGYVSDARIMKSLNPAADKAALDVVNSMNENVGKWTPGTKEGVPAMMDMVLPISFVLGTPNEKELKTTNIQGAGTIEMPQSDDQPFTYVEHMPTFPDGQEAMYKFIYERIKYPALARENGISGQVIIQFVVSKEGYIQNAKVLRGIGGGCNEEALRVINEMPRWNAGQHDGKPVAVTFTLPIKFVLQSKEGKIKQSNSDTLKEKQSLEPTTVIALKDWEYTPTNKVNYNLHLSPNPARDHVEIDLFEGAQTIFVFTIDGVQMTKIEVSKSAQTHYRIDTSKYAVGQYSVQVVSSKEVRSAQFAVIK